MALQIRNKWPGWYEQFRSYSGKLGTASIYWTGDHNALVIASLYAQEFYGKGLQTDYTAFENALIDLKRNLEWNALENESVYFPVNIGCGLAGGDWNVIKPLIEKYLPNAIIVEKP